LYDVEERRKKNRRKIKDLCGTMIRWISVWIFWTWWIQTAQSFAHKPTTKKVVIAGAGSSVGYLVFKKILQRHEEFYPVGLVKDRRGYNALRKLGAGPDQIRICDITMPDTLRGAFNGSEKAVICTSAVPKKTLQYKICNTLRWIAGKARPPLSHDLYYKRHRRPYEVDYLGQKHIVDECVASNVDHIVLLGTMGGYSGNMLNDIGRQPDDKDLKNGNILKWKRAAERYLMKRKFFTIIHAAALTDDRGGQHEVIWDTDDALLRTPYKKIPREDVAECIVQALIWEEAIGKSIDVSSGPEAKPTKDWFRFWARPGSCMYPADYDGFPKD
jgi:hypothetical protein